MPFDWQALLDLAPVAVGALRPGSPEAAAMLQGYLQSKEQIRQEARQRQHDTLLQQQVTRQQALTQAQIDTNNDLAAQRAALARLGAFDAYQTQRTAELGEGATDPLAAQNQLAIDLLGRSHALGLPPSLMAGTLPNMTERVSRGVKKDAHDLLEQIGKHVPEAGQTDASVLVEWDGQTPRLQAALTARGHRATDPIKISEVRSLMGIGVNPTTGLPWQPAAPVKPPVAGTLADYLSAQPDQQAAILAGHRRFAEANQPPRDTTAGGQSRLDKSYQYTNSQVEKLRTPLQAQGERISRLVESLNQQTPAADALVAPELLTAMAGGMGSGLRMNEAEIARIVGGRSQWETLKATLNKWQTNPSKALSITDSQRAQMRSLVNAMQGRIQAKLTALNEASQALIDAPDVTSHRVIVSRANQRLQTVDREGAPLAGPERRPIPGIPGGEAEWRDGKWIRVK